MKSIAELGYEKPSPIQAQALPLLLGDNTDFLGLAATGTGKTAAFSIPMLEKIDISLRSVQTLILCPTRELAVQVSGQIDLLGKHKGIKSVPIYGGSSYGDQIYALRRGVQVVVGTPGRVIDHIEKGTLRLDDIKTVILDEADEMISMGFKEDLEKILSTVPREESNIWLFSATMSREVRKVADQFLRSPKQVQINRTEMLPSTIEQYYYLTQESNKPEVLCKLIDAAEDLYGLVFCQTKSLVADLTQYLTDRGYKVDCLHGDKDQRQRERTMQAFRDRKVQLLICTDVASRGLDVKDITHVINYSIPRELDSYVHRIGRTARSGKTGIAMSLVSASNRRQIGLLEHMTKSRMMEGKVPSRRELGTKKVSKVLPGFLGQTLHKRAAELLDPSWKEALANLTAEEVASRFLTLMHPEVFADSEIPKMSRMEPEGASKRPSRDGGGRDGGRPSFGGPRSDRGNFVPRSASSAPSPVRAVGSAPAPRVAPAAPARVTSTPAASIAPVALRKEAAPVVEPVAKKEVVARAKEVSAPRAAKSVEVEPTHSIADLTSAPAAFGVRSEASVSAAAKPRSPKSVDKYADKKGKAGKKSVAPAPIKRASPFAKKSREVVQDGGDRPWPRRKTDNQMNGPKNAFK